MSGYSFLLGPQPDDPKQVELVQRISEKTREGKIAWSKTKTGISASLSGKMVVSFVASPTLLGLGGHEWAVFTIRGEKGNEILKVENVGDIVGVLTGRSKEGGPLVKAANELFNLVQESAKGDVEKALDLVSRI
jgi:hypothetical protein